jgi:hypothetical protein
MLSLMSTTPARPFGPGRRFMGKREPDRKFRRANLRYCSLGLAAELSFPRRREPSNRKRFDSKYDRGYWMPACAGMTAQ